MVQLSKSYDMICTSFICVDSNDIWILHNLVSAHTQTLAVILINIYMWEWWILNLDKKIFEGKNWFQTESEAFDFEEDKKRYFLI